DFDRNGRQDLVLLKGPVVVSFDGNQVHMTPLGVPLGAANYNTFWTISGPLPTHTSWDLSELADVDGDGLEDILQVDASTGQFEWSKRLGGSPPDLLRGIHEGVASDGLPSVVVTYATLGDRTVYTPTTAACAYPERCLRADPL